MPSETAAIEFYRELKEFADQEARAQRENYNRSLALPLAKRVETGRCIETLHFDRRTAVGAYRFICDENLTDFREGDLVRLHHGDPFDPEFEFTWFGDDALDDRRDYIDFVPMGKDAHVAIERHATFTLDASFFDLSRQISDAIEELGRTARGRDRILPLLMGAIEEDTVDAEQYELAFDEAERAGFNESQQEAIAAAAAADWCCLIQGPPGTGKTRVIANIAKQRLERGERVLVTACTHRAIHEALCAIHRAMPSFDRIAKISQPVHDPGFPVAQYENFSDLPFSKSEESYLIGATPYAARSKRLAGVEFDCVLIDEASQMTLPLAVMAMLSADQYVIVGDPQQLPPVVQSCPAWEAPTHSVFGAMKRWRNLQRLNTTYRLNREIADWVGESFYRSDLRSAETAMDRKLHLTGASSQSWLEQSLSPEQSLVWIRTQTDSTRHYSIEEASLITQIIVELHRRGHALEEIGVVTPFRRQARTIKRRLRQSLDLPVDLTQAIVIDTVERMQGQERTVILISTAAGDLGFIAAIHEFLYLPQRLNVAVSRARTKVITLATDNLLKTQPGYADEVVEAIDHWNSLQQRSFEITL